MFELGRALCFQLIHPRPPAGSLGMVKTEESIDRWFSGGLFRVARLLSPRNVPLQVTSCVMRPSVLDVSPANGHVPGDHGHSLTMFFFVSHWLEKISQEPDEEQPRRGTAAQAPS